MSLLTEPVRSTVFAAIPSSRAGDPALPRLSVEFIGTGDSYGVPAFGCECAICREAAYNLELRRTPICTVLNAEGEALALEAGCIEFATVLERYRISAVLVSDYSPGHVYGLRSARPRPLRVIGPPSEPSGEPGIDDRPPVAGRIAAEPFREMAIGGFTAVAFPSSPGGRRFGYWVAVGDWRIVYVRRMGSMPGESIDFLVDRGVDLVVAGLPRAPDGGAIEALASLAPGRCLLTGLDCKEDAWLDSHGETLPGDAERARDGRVFPLLERRVAEAG